MPCICDQKVERHQDKITCPTCNESFHCSCMNINAMRRDSPCSPPLHRITGASTSSGSAEDNALDAALKIFSNGLDVNRCLLC